MEFMSSATLWLMQGFFRGSEEVNQFIRRSQRVENILRIFKK
jgi:hypothetical protein